jgi:1-phosphofructokinase
MGTDAPQLVVIGSPPMLTVTIEAAPEDATGDEIHVHAGGQGFWVARMAARLEVRVRFCVPLGGETGTVLSGLIESESIELNRVEMAQENPAYVHDRRSGERQPLATSADPVLTRHEADELYNHALAAGLQGELVVLTGTHESLGLPTDFYRRLAADFGANDVRVVADLSGEALEAALEGGLELVKLSEEEVIESGLSPSGELDELLAAMSRLRDAGARNVLVSRGEEPALALADGRFLELIAPRFEVEDHRGSGDTMSAATFAALVKGESIETALQLGAAAGALNVTRRGLGTAGTDPADELRGKVRLREIEVAGHPASA